MGFARLQPEQLAGRLQDAVPPLLLDIRRREAFAKLPQGIAGAVPLLLDEKDPKIPPVARDAPIVTYCLCSGEASSLRVALWLSQAGYTDISVLVGGLPAWIDRQLPLAPIAPLAAASVPADWRPVLQASPAAAPAAAEGLVPLQSEQTFLAGVPLPTRRELAVLFVDMVDSTQLLFRHEPEQVLALVQAFMELVVDVAIHHCGDVHDFEGDGAMLFFAGPGEAVPAAFRLRELLDERRRSLPELPQARFALDAGPLVIGPVGTRHRRALSFIGPSVNIAARILKLAPPGGIVATEGMFGHAQWTDPALAARFAPLPEKQQLKGIARPVTVYLSP